MLVVSDPGQPAGMPRRAIPPTCRAWQRRDALPTSNCHLEWRCVRGPIPDAGAGRGDATSESLWATRASLLLMIIGGGITSPV
jgi:hypothetical protein